MNSLHVVYKFPVEPRLTAKAWTSAMSSDRYKYLSPLAHLSRLTHLQCFLWFDGIASHYLFCAHFPQKPHHFFFLFFSFLKCQQNYGRFRNCFYYSLFTLFINIVSQAALSLKNAFAAFTHFSNTFFLIQRKKMYIMSSSRRSTRS